MLNAQGLTVLTSLLAISLLSIGCAKEAPPAATAPEATAPAATDAPADAATDAAAETATADEVAAAFAALSEADRAAALAQKICPVSGHELGGMGTPIKVDVAGRAVFICCESCKDPLLAEPDKYLAKLDAPAP